MIKEVVMPKLGLTMSYGEITEWKVRPGERVKKDDVIGTVETDKVTGDIPAPCDGVITEIIAQAGDEKDTLEPIALIDDEA
jgi:pyruvate/2-oxoglutarate dehydrogenase complex dihydrolipoamide acyltransferase (E2) component